jgi:hypothetical protein
VEGYLIRTSSGAMVFNEIEGGNVDSEVDPFTNRRQGFKVFRFASDQIKRITK